MELDPKAADFLRLAADLIADQSKRIAALSADLAAARAELNQAQCHQGRAALCCPGPLPGIELGKVPGPDLSPLYDDTRPEPIPGGPMLYATRPAGNGGR